MKLSIGEIIFEAAKKSTVEEKVAYLHANDSVPLQYILQMAFDPKFEWNLPEGDPPYKPCEYLDIEGVLYTEVRRLYLFLKGFGSSIEDPKHNFKRENLWIQLLESISPQDAKVLCLVKNKKFPIRGLNESTIRIAWPDLIPKRTYPEGTFTPKKFKKKDVKTEENKKENVEDQEAA